MNSHTNIEAEELRTLLQQTGHIFKIIPKFSFDTKTTTKIYKNTFRIQKWNQTDNRSTNSRSPSPSQSNKFLQILKKSNLTNKSKTLKTRTAQRDLHSALPIHKKHNETPKSSRKTHRFTNIERRSQRKQHQNHKNTQDSNRDRTTDLKTHQ